MARRGPDILTIEPGEAVRAQTDLGRGLRRVDRELLEWPALRDGEGDRVPIGIVAESDQEFENVGGGRDLSKLAFTPLRNRGACITTDHDIGTG